MENITNLSTQGLVRLVNLLVDLRIKSLGVEIKNDSEIVDNIDELVDALRRTEVSIQSYCLQTMH